MECFDVRDSIVLGVKRRIDNGIGVVFAGLAQWKRDACVFILRELLDESYCVGDSCAATASILK
jgi:hypothetical protein